MELHERVREFTKQTVAAMGVPLEVTIVDAGDNIRVELSGGARKRSTRFSRSSIPRSAASSRTIGRSSSTAWTTGKPRTRSCGRWRAS